MALRNQPYLPLYVDDFMVDEKLRECSAESTGVYIRIMCLMHKSEEYGVVLLKQKDKQNSSAYLNFANKLAMHLPYPVDVIERSLEELVLNGVIQIDEDKILQKRMVKDFHISELRAKVGKIGGDKSAFGRGFAKANAKANSVNENENENINDTDSDKEKGGAGGKGKRQTFTKPTIMEIMAYCTERMNNVDAEKFFDYYESNGWMVGKNKMKDWQATVRTWEKNGTGSGNQYARSNQQDMSAGRRILDL